MSTPAALETEWVWTSPDASPGVVDLVRSVGSWSAAPSSWCGGRSGWQLLGEAEGIGRALKFKGLGLAPTVDRPAQPPSTGAYDRWPGQEPDPHFGVGGDGEFCVIPGSPSPLGGLTIEGAHREIACASALAAAGVAAVTPVAVGAYPSLRFRVGAEETSLGVSVTGSPVASLARVGVVLPGFPGVAGVDVDAELERLGRLLRVDGGSDSGWRSAEARVALLGAAYRRFGETISAFSASGWYRYSGHPGNFVIDDDGRAVVVDLDSCRPAEGIGPEQAALEEVRDGMSALYNLACSFFLPSVIGAIPDEAILADPPFTSFLDGWDPMSAGTNAAVGRAIAEYVVRSRVQLRTFGEFLASPSPAGRMLYRHVRHDRDLTFSWLLRIAYQRRLARPDSRAMPWTLGELDDRLLRFAGRDRYERMQELGH